MSYILRHSSRDPYTDYRTEMLAVSRLKTPPVASRESTEREATVGYTPAADVLLRITAAGAASLIIFLFLM